VFLSRMFPIRFSLFKNFCLGNINSHSNNLFKENCFLPNFIILRHNTTILTCSRFSGMRFPSCFCTVNEKNLPNNQLGKPSSNSINKTKDIKENSTSISSSFRIDVIFEDEDYCFVVKPHDMATSGNIKTKSERSSTSSMNKTRRENQFKNFHNYVSEYILLQKKTSHMPSLLHRLDKVSSGVMVFGKNKRSEIHFQNALQKQNIIKGYLVMVRGEPRKSRGTLKAGIIRTAKDMRRFSIVRDGGGLLTVTHYRVMGRCKIEGFGSCSLLALRIVTGRRHQIRAVCSSLGCPIVGDFLYGGGKFSQTLLHSAYMKFPHWNLTKDYEIFCGPTWPNSVSMTLDDTSLLTAFREMGKLVAPVVGLTNGETNKDRTKPKIKLERRMISTKSKEHILKNQ